MSHSKIQLSVVVAVYNEAKGLSEFNASLIAVLQSIVPNDYEVIYCDDGSTDSTAKIVHELHSANAAVKLVSLSRNFGKENALTAGITHAQGSAVLTIDGDGQHPVELIPDFFKRWQDGAQVVIGVRTNNSGQGAFKRIGTKLFYWFFNKFLGYKLLPGSTDFRLIDSQVQQAFLQLHETDRITRGLIDWLGFKRELIPFECKERLSGTPSYSYKKLLLLAKDSIVSSSPAPLYFFGIIGVFITALSLLLGIAVIIEQLILSDPLKWNFTGTAMLSIFVLFLVGMVLVSQGLLSLYISHIHSQVKQRPLYVINTKSSIGL